MVAQIAQIEHVLQVEQIAQIPQDALVEQIEQVKKQIAIGVEWKLQF